MAIDRPALTTWLTTWRGKVATTAGRLLTDTTTGWGPVLDEVAKVDTANPNLATFWHEPLADYYALRLIANDLDTRFDLTIDGDSLRLRQVTDGLRKQLEATEARVKWLIVSGAISAVPYAGGLTLSDLEERADDPELFEPFFTRRTGPPDRPQQDERWP